MTGVYLQKMALAFILDISWQVISGSPNMLFIFWVKPQVYSVKAGHYGQWFNFSFLSQYHNIYYIFIFCHENKLVFWHKSTSSIVQIFNDIWNVYKFETDRLSMFESFHWSHWNLHNYTNINGRWLSLVQLQTRYSSLVVLIYSGFQTEASLTFLPSKDNNFGVKTTLGDFFIWDSSTYKITY